MSSTPSLYRYINFIGGNILDASNMALLQTELQRLGGQGLGQMFQQGAMLNVVFNITGSSIVMTHANSSFPIFVFVNNQWESLGNTVSIAGTQPTSGSSNNLYLNWSLNIVTSTSDPSFLDGITGEPTIQAGQLSLDVDWLDTSGTSLNPTTQFFKNTSPIVLAVFNMSGASPTVAYQNAIFPYAAGNSTQAGLVQLTDNSGIAPGNTDARLSNSRNPNPGSVYNSSVASLISSGTNSSSLPAWAAGTVYTVGNQIVDSNGNIETVVAIAGSGISQSPTAPTWNTTLGSTTVDNPGANQITWVNGGPASTTKYDPATSGQGGIFTDSIIYTTLKEKLTDFLNNVNSGIENALIALGNHIGKPLGSSETHPFPTASQVGAAPASHVGQTLGLGTSHPAQVNSDHSGFTVLRNPAVTPSTTDYGYAITDGTNVKSALSHPGDVWSLLANAANAQGLNGTMGPATNRGTLGYLSLIAAVLAEHVNYNTHGNNNPHNINAADIGAVSAAYVDSQVSDIVADLSAYTDARSTIAVRVVTTTGAALGEIGNNFPTSHITGDYVKWLGSANATITYVIFTFGGAFEIAVGFGTYGNQQQVALPETSGWSSSNWYGTAAHAWTYSIAYDSRGYYVNAYVDPSTRLVTVAADADSSQNQNGYPGIASVTALCYRTITPPPFMISATDNTTGTINEGYPGDSVTIVGRNFGASQSGATIKFNGTAVSSYTSWSSNSVTVVIPSGATSGVLTITLSGGSPVNSPFTFTIL